MKALIVDDEKHVRDAIRLLVNWPSFDIDTLLEAEDGESASRIIQEEKPELVFTDMMMPGMGGTGLLEWIHTHSPRSKTVVISGHDDFDLVRTAIKYGGLDYILKPIDPGDLNEAVRKAVETRKREEEALLQQQKRNMEVNQIKPVYWDRMLSNLLDDPGYYEKIKESLISELGYSPDCTDCRIAVLSLEAVPVEVSRKFSSGMDLLYFSLTNICNEYLNERKSGYAFCRYDGPGHIVLLFWRNTAHAEEEVKRIYEGILRTLKARFDFSLGCVQAFPKGIPISYQDALGALRSRNLLKRSGWIHTAHADSVLLKPLPFGEFEEQLRLAIRSTNEEQMDNAISAWFESISRLDYISIEQFELWKHELGVFQVRTLKELFGDNLEESKELADAQAFPLPLLDDGTLSLPAWKERVAAIIKGIAEVYSKSHHEDKHAIYEIAKYIQAHYNEDITLQDIADRFFLSREYISRKFKQEFKENLSDYIGRIRIEKAKLLLLNPASRIAQVAEQVGYQDEKYFSKVFKKMTGFTPGEYRKNPTPSDK
jgi:two-component system, response regulator YesN